MTAVSNTDVATVRLRAADGAFLDLPVHRWFAPAEAAEQPVLDRAIGPVLDIGCGPGRHLEALAARGIFGLGIDVSRPMVDAARRRGVTVLERCVYGDVPGAGQWGSALLLDGNIGIGGDPSELLLRVRSLLRPDGRILAEVQPDDDLPAEPILVRAESATSTGPWFRWTTVGADQLTDVAHTAGLQIVERWETNGRVFAHLERKQQPA